VASTTKSKDFQFTFVSTKTCNVRAC
jgi:hypothetical protein